MRPLVVLSLATASALTLRAAQAEGPDPAPAPEAPAPPPPPAPVPAPAPLVSPPPTAAAPTTPPAPPAAPAWKLSDGAKIKLSADGKAFIRFMTWHQFWGRYTEMNPGSVVREVEHGSTLDFGLRRSRALIYAKPTDDLTIVFHFGINNQSTVAGGYGAGTDGPKKPQMFIHDAYGEHRVIGDYLFFGAGLHYWNGISRMTSASTITFLAFDSPIIHWPTIDKHDQFARQMGAYVKGELGPAHYRIALNQPFVTPSLPAVDKADLSSDVRTMALQGYLNVDLLEKESHALPYFTGTYIGKKKVFNLGAGWYWQKDGAVWLEGTERKFGKVLLGGLDAFLDLPFDGGKHALTAYASFLHYDFGPNYIRNVGIMNPSTGLFPGSTASFNGAGNAAPIIGTGNVVYGQAGYLLPFDLGNAGKLQPYAAITWAKYEALADAVTIPEAGLNWFVDGHNAKLTLHYKSRPVFVPVTGGKPKLDTHKSEVILQGQVFF